MKWVIRLGVFFILCGSAFASYAQSEGGRQVIQINTRFRSFIGKPIWLLEIRDLDHNENIPYIFEVTQRENYWVVYINARHYTINASNMQFRLPEANTYLSKRIYNFCNLQSNGRVMKGTSLNITIDGRLTPNAHGIRCNVTTYTDPNFTVTNPGAY